MLFRALIDRLFGTNDRQDQTGSQTHIRTSRLSYEKYPSLPRLLVMLLGGDSRNASRQNGNGEISTSAPAEFVFPALEIIRRAGPPPEESVTISALVMQHLGSNIWNIRVMAARTYCSLVIDRDFLDSVAILLDVDGYTSNRLHGILLSVKFLGERYLSFEGGRWQGK